MKIDRKNAIEAKITTIYVHINRQIENKQSWATARQCLIKGRGYLARCVVAGGHNAASPYCCVVAQRGILKP